MRNRFHRPGDGKISGGDGGVPPDDGLLYRYEGESMEVINARTKGRGTVLHHWNLIAYDLEPISQLWERRLDHESGQGETFAEYGVFASEGDPIGTARLNDNTRFPLSPILTRHSTRPIMVVKSMTTDSSLVCSSSVSP